ncbi:hypothetical protein H6G00_29345 [Leptolyngbya sp. FACHB-541]|uniref:hypothetical protein n=1 Tax=Leptolyngbya sp. FACHB-541 TaxID=2692810 RepID=UPI001689A20D|nr:hypothetical protein [Leptolyngbya sp. FACHB-541]MBD2000665.1 hypothetical protein [Leptolyngbya sp. FACHB-541]
MAIARPLSRSTTHHVRRDYSLLVHLHQEAGLKGISVRELLRKRTQKHIDQLLKR